MQDIVIRGIGNIMSAYMLLILVRWTAGWLEFDIHSARWDWICRLTDPLIIKLRQILPHMGPFDFGPLAALCLVWLVKLITWQVMVQMKFD